MEPIHFNQKVDQLTNWSVGVVPAPSPLPATFHQKGFLFYFIFFYFENFLCPASFNIDTEINSLSLPPSPIFIKFIFEKGKSLNNKTKKRRPDAVPSFVATPLPALFHCSDFATDFQVCWDVVNCWSSTFFFSSLCLLCDHWPADGDEKIVWVDTLDAHKWKQTLDPGNLLFIE